jgi:hypothetical protein
MSTSMFRPHRAVETRNRGIAVRSMALWTANRLPRRWLWVCLGWGWGLAGVLVFVAGRRVFGLSVLV